MCGPSSGANFGIYFDPNKSTSGQRFFGELFRELAQEAFPLKERPAAVLFNISAPIWAIVAAKLWRQKIVLRVDGLYFDRLSDEYLSTFKWPLRKLFSWGRKYSWARDWLAHLANLLNQNYTAFARIILADFIIYQSEYSRDAHRRYFPRKAYRIIVNGAEFHSKVSQNRTSSHGEIRLVTVYDDWKPAKRVHDLVKFVQWAHEHKKVPVRLAILGYTGKFSPCVPPTIKDLIESSPFIRTIPRFSSFGGEVRDVLLDSDAYLTFTYRDPCPNVVVEAMAHGLPVIGVASGGVPDIVGNAGILLPERDTAGFFSASRYENNFPTIDFEKVLAAVNEVKANAAFYRERVRDRFSKDLDIRIVAERYASVLRHLAGSRCSGASEVKPSK